MEQTTSRRTVLRHNLRQTFIAIDQLANALVGLLVALFSLMRLMRRPAGLWWADETISAHCWRWHVHGIRHWPQRLVDAIARVLGDTDHCRESYLSERFGRQLPPELRPRDGP